MDYTVVKEDLQKFLCDALRIAVVGIGQGCRQDDAVGIFIVQDLFIKLSGGQEPPLKLYEKEFLTAVGRVRLYQGHETPESLTGSLRKFLPTHVLFIDAAQLAEAPGTMELVPISMIQGETLSTHDLPLSILGEFLEKDMGSKVMLLGIQPLSIQLGYEKGLSKAVAEAVSTVSDTIIQVLKPQV